MTTTQTSNADRQVPTRRISFEEALQDLPTHFAEDGDIVGCHLIASLSGVFPDGEGKMNRSVADTTRQMLVVSQFTLYGDASGGRRPSWIAAARPEHAEPLVDVVVDHLRSLGGTVATGRFRTEMHVSIVNDGPVTLMLEV